MKKSIGYRLLIMSVVLLAGVVLYSALFRLDNKYTAALTGGYGYNTLEDGGKQVSFLIDGWEYYPGQLLEPEDFAAGQTPAAYTYIGEYANFSQQLGHPWGTATYRILLQGGEEGQTLALWLPELLCAGRIYINGTLAGEQGSVQPYQPRIVDGLYPFTPREDTEIIIQCANYTHYYSGMYYPPAVGTLEAVTGMVTARLILYGVLCFASLAVALSNLAQWLLSRDPLTRWLGLLCLAFSLWVSYPFLRALGVPLVRPLYALEDFCCSLVLLCAILLAGELSSAVNRQFHRRAAVPAALAVCAASVVFPLLILPLAPSLIGFYGLFFFLWEPAAGLYLIFLSFCCLRTSRPVLGGYLLAASSFYGLSAAAASLTVNYFEPIRGAWLQEYGGFSLVVGFAALMVHRGVLLSRENHRLTFHLQEEVDRKTHAVETLLRERRELLGSLIHDLKNPLAAVQGYSELVLRDGVALDRETAGYLDALRERAAVMGERFEQLQTFSRRERGVLPRENICLNQLLLRFYRSNQPDIELSGQSFRLELPREEVHLPGDESRLWIALENLCYNALGFTGEGDVITLGLKTEDNTAVIWVKDTGRGIPQEDLPHLFQWGFTSRADSGGEGLGLFIVRTVALEHDGTVEVSSRPGEGSTFFLRLPLAR